MLNIIGASLLISIPIFLVYFSWWLMKEDRDMCRSQAKAAIAENAELRAKFDAMVKFVEAGRCAECGREVV